MTDPEVTPAVRRAGEAIEDAAFRLVGRDLGTIYRDQIAREGLAAGLDVEEIGVELDHHGRWPLPGNSEYDYVCPCGEALGDFPDPYARTRGAHIRAWKRHRSAALRDKIIGGSS